MLIKCQGAPRSDEGAPCYDEGEPCSDRSVLRSDESELRSDESVLRSDESALRYDRSVLCSDQSAPIYKEGETDFLLRLFYVYIRLRRSAFILYLQVFDCFLFNRIAPLFYFAFLLFTYHLLVGSFIYRVFLFKKEELKSTVYCFKSGFDFFYKRASATTKVLPPTNIKSWGAACS